ncbi:hypothetical protein SH580_03110 [Coraliomargarita algicola]|uniref:Right handed beta helix domain-containing protein n=1 Tax=Coraliomargarita algicola TaxID=3092156 RepID=A0ABZ0RKV1_9BACT|nr:hypothetical protein [Coraliomargarita sp. J2-16]WPJ96692.1 hypothetical protein SH580_03110 [Coraliomargarita sp. J2-16]
MKLRPHLMLFLAWASVYSLANSADFYVDVSLGDDGAIGSKMYPFATIERAMREVDGPGGTIHLQAGMTYREEVVIRKGGTEVTPLVIEGNGAVINLGRDVTSGPWEVVGDAYRLNLEIPEFSRHYVTSPLFVNGLPVWAEHPEGRGKPAWHGGSLKYNELGQMIVRFPEGLTPENARVVITGPDRSPAVHASGGQYVIIRNLTTAFAGNDGFNFHNRCTNFKLEGVRALFNGDQGISSHGQCEVHVYQSEVAFNGSQSAGVVDINDAVTKYTNVLCHHNRGSGFLLRGKAHKLESVVAFGHIAADLPRSSESIDIVDSFSGEVRLPAQFLDGDCASTLAQRSERFESLLP